MALAALPLLLAATAYANEPAQPPAADDDAQPVIPVGRVSVTAMRADRDVLDVAGNVTLIDREEIERSGVSNVAELLRRQAGLVVTNTTSNPAGYTVDARGFNNGGGNGSNLLVQIDGLRANEPDSDTPDWALIPLDEIESIEIVRGPASAVYGDNAAGGVVNIRTRTGEGPLYATLRGSIARYDSGGGSLKTGGTVGGVTGSFYLGGFTTDGYRIGSDFEQLDVKGSLETTLNDWLVIGAEAGHHDDDRELPGFLDADQLRTLGRRARNPASDMDGNEVEANFVRGWIEAALGEHTELRIRPHARWRDDAAVATFAGGGGTLTGDSEKRSFGIDAQLQLDHPVFGRTNRLIAGTEVLRAHTDRSDAFSSAFFNSQTFSNNSKSVYSGFLQNELNLTDWLLLSAGVRYDRAEYEIEILDPAIFAGDPALGLAAGKPHFDVWSPRAGITWRPHDDFSAYFSYARGFRLPNLDESSPILTGIPGDPPTVPDFEKQISDSYEIGAKVRHERADVGLALYYMDVRNELILNPELGLFGGNENFPRVRHRGIEAWLELRLCEWLTTHATYTFEDVEVRSHPNPALVGAPVPITPAHRGTLGASLDLPFDVEFDVHANLIGRRFIGNDFLRSVSPLPFTGTVDLLLAWRPSLGEHLEASFTVGVRNVGGEEYFGTATRSASSTTVGFYPAPGRVWEFGIVLRGRR